MSKTASLDIGDIQATVLRPRPSPYKGEYVLLRIDDATQGREMLRPLFLMWHRRKSGGYLVFLLGLVSLLHIKD